MKFGMLLHSVMVFFVTNIKIDSINRFKIATIKHLLKFFEILSPYGYSFLKAAFKGTDNNYMYYRIKLNRTSNG